MNVMISGANGFIGSRLCNYYASNKDNIVYALIKDEKEDTSMLNDNIKIVYCDLLLMNSLDGLVIDEIDVFYNLAWIGVSTTHKNDFDLQYLNIKFSYNSIMIAREVNSKKYVGIGSMSEFAYSNSSISGDEVPCPSDYYSAAKVSSRYFCELFATQNNISFNWTFITSIYGPGRTDNNIITYTIKSLLNNETPEYTGLEQKWDYVYIDDVIEALVAIGRYGKNKKCYTIGSGVARPIKEYIIELKNILNPNAKLSIGVLPYKTDRIDNSVVDITNLCNDTKFYPKVSFAEGIKKTIEFFKNGDKK